jgi:signal transduction histidine kinase
MSNWLRGKWGGFLGFLGIAALVAGGLGWATAAVLRLEHEHRIARAEAEQAGKLRLALWQLDSLILPDLSREVTRPINQYTSSSPRGRTTGAVLGSVEFPPWILMHLQSTAGKWQSPELARQTQAPHRQEQRPGPNPEIASERKRVLTEFQSQWQPTTLLALVEDRGPELLEAKTAQVASNLNDQTIQVNKGKQVVMPDQSGDWGKRQAYKNRINEEALKQQSLPIVTVRVSKQMVPLWLTTRGKYERLILARRVQIGAKKLCQAVVIDWPRLHRVLAEQIHDIFPDVRFVPVFDKVPPHPERTMTALPVEVVPAPAAASLSPPGWTPLRIGLVIAWAAVVLALLSVGVGGWSLLDLSERRSRFVSAVTHELRTPLTTLRLYLDMLTNGLVYEERQKAEYLETLHAEAERLNRLIANVLDFSRLEKQRPQLTKSTVAVAGLLADIGATWHVRCQGAGKQLVIDNATNPEEKVVTDVHLVQQILGNLIDNACKYSRSAEDRRVWVRARQENKYLVLEVEDRGPGIPIRERRSIFSPFRRGLRAEEIAGGVGLGLALAHRWAHLLGGILTLQSRSDTTGACFRLDLPNG